MVADITPEYQPNTRKRVHIRVHKSIIEMRLSVPAIKQRLAQPKRDFVGVKVFYNRNKAIFYLPWIDNFSRALYRLGY